MPSHSNYISMVELTERLEPLVPKGCFLTPEAFYTSRPMGFGPVTVTVEMRLDGPNKGDETEITVTRRTKAEVLDALEKWLS